MTHDPWS